MERRDALADEKQPTGVSGLATLRWLFVAACGGCLAFVVYYGHWEARLARANDTWIMDLPYTPIWAPPDVPTYGAFEASFKGSAGFPGPDDPQISIRRTLKLDSMALNLLLCLWPVTMLTAVLYVAVRHEHRDLLLHFVMSAAVGLTIGAAACVGLWLLCGGWGAPSPELFGGAGLIGGILAGRASFQRDPTRTGQFADYREPR